VAAGKCPRLISRMHRLLDAAAQLLGKCPWLGLAFCIAVGIGMLAILFRASDELGTAHLHITLVHNFRSAYITIWVDDKLAYSGQTTGALRRRFGFLPGSVNGSFARVLQVPSGKHEICVKVQALSEGFDQTAKTQVEFPTNADLTLAVVVSRHDLAVAWKGGPSELANSQPSWYIRYASSLLMTLAGSIVSAITAFVIREIPSVLHRPASSRK